MKTLKTLKTLVSLVSIMTFMSFMVGDASYPDTGNEARQRLEKGPQVMKPGYLQLDEWKSGGVNSLEVEKRKTIEKGMEEQKESREEIKPKLKGPRGGAEKVEAKETPSVDPTVLIGEALLNEAIEKRAQIVQTLTNGNTVTVWNEGGNDLRFKITDREGKLLIEKSITPIPGSEYTSIQNLYDAGGGSFVAELTGSAILTDDKGNSTIVYYTDYRIYGNKGEEKSFPLEKGASIQRLAPIGDGKFALAIKRDNRVYLRITDNNFTKLTETPIRNIEPSYYSQYVSGIVSLGNDRFAVAYNGPSVSGTARYANAGGYVEIFDIEKNEKTGAYTMKSVAEKYFADTYKYEEGRLSERIIYTISHIEALGEEKFVIVLNKNAAFYKYAPNQVSVRNISLQTDIEIFSVTNDTGSGEALIESLYTCPIVNEYYDNPDMTTKDVSRLKYFKALDDNTVVAAVERERWYMEVDDRGRPQYAKVGEEVILKMIDIQGNKNNIEVTGSMGTDSHKTIKQVVALGEGRVGLIMEEYKNGKYLTSPFQFNKSGEMVNAQTIGSPKEEQIKSFEFQKPFRTTRGETESDFYKSINALEKKGLADKPKLITTLKPNLLENPALEGNLGEEHLKVDLGKNALGEEHLRDLLENALKGRGGLEIYRELQLSSRDIDSILVRMSDKSDEEKEKIREAVKSIETEALNIDEEDMEEFKEAIRLVATAETMQNLLEGVDFGAIKGAFDNLILEQEGLYKKHLRLTEESYKGIEDLLRLDLKDEQLPERYLYAKELTIQAKRKIIADIALKELEAKDEKGLEDNEKEALNIYRNSLLPMQKTYRENLGLALKKFIFTVKEALSDAKPASVSKKGSSFKAMFHIPEEAE